MAAPIHSEVPRSVPWSEGKGPRTVEPGAPITSPSVRALLHTAGRATGPPCPQDSSLVHASLAPALLGTRGGAAAPSPSPRDNGVLCGRLQA